MDLLSAAFRDMSDPSVEAFCEETEYVLLGEQSTCWTGTCEILGKSKQ